MPNEPVWVSAEELIELNRRIVEASKEPHTLLMEDVLRGAANRPYEFWCRGEENLASLGVRLLIGVSRAQTFVQGNKRTGFYGAMRFFDYNGLYLDIDDAEDVAQLIIDICQRMALEEDLIEEFQPRLIETL